MKRSTLTRVYKSRVCSYQVKTKVYKSQLLSYTVTKPVILGTISGNTYLKSIGIISGNPEFTYATT
jgi:hypothetical protein